MAGEKYIEIGGRLHSIATGNVALGANEVFDDDKNKKQSEINNEVASTLLTHSSSIAGLNTQNYVTVTATEETTDVTDVLPATGVANTIYRVGSWEGSQFDASVYSEYAWNGSQYIHLSTKTKIGEVFDISAYYATGDTLATYADLSAALDSNNGGVPQSLQKGGMSIKFVSSSDNKYVQYRLIADSWTTDKNYWQDISLYETISLLDSNIWEKGKIDATSGKIDPSYNDRLATKMLPFKREELLSIGEKESGIHFSYTIYCYDKYGTYLGYKSGTKSIREAVSDYPNAYLFRFGLINVTGVSPIIPSNINNIITSWRNPFIYKFLFTTLYDNYVNETILEKIHDSLTYQVNFIQKDNWVNGGTDTNTGIIDPSKTNRLSSKLIPFMPANITFRKAGGVNFQVNVYCYDYEQNYLGPLLNNSSIIDAYASYPNAVYFRIGLISISGVSPISADNISNIISYGITYAWKYAISKGLNDIIIKNIDKEALEREAAISNVAFSTGEKINETGIDDIPTAGSNNLVKSGVVAEELALGAIYDVSAKNPTAGTNNDGKWESFSALLYDANLNTLIPTSVRKGGMSIKFAQTDNKYVQFKYMLKYENTTAGNNAFMNPKNWEDLSVCVDIDLTDSNYWVDGKVDSSTGEIVSDSTRVLTKMLPFTKNEVIELSNASGVSYTYTMRCYDKFRNYLGYKPSLSIADCVTDFPSAEFFRIELINVSGITPVNALNIGNIISYSNHPNIYKYVFSTSYDAVNKDYVNTEISKAVKDVIDLNNGENWVNGGVVTNTGIIDSSKTDRLSTKMFQFREDVVFSYTKPSEVSWFANIYCYDKSKKYLGVVISTNSVSDGLANYPTAVWFRIGLVGISGVTPVNASNIANIVIFNSTYSVKKYTEMSEFQALENSDKLYGKLWYACGDSFTEGVIKDSPLPNGKYAGKKQVYPYFIGNRTGMEVMNIAVSGSTITYISGTSTSSNCFTYPSTGKLYTIPTNAEYITLKFGINDSHQNVPIGTIDDETNTTLYGAWNVAISYLLNKCPFAKIGIIVTNGCDSPEYAQAGKDIAKKWGLSYLDENFGYEVPLLHRVNGKPLVCSEAHQNRMENFRISANNTHPNNKAHEFESTFVEAWLRTL